MASSVQPWQRQPYESEPQFAAFQIYRDMPKPRSVDGAYRRYLAQQRGLQESDPAVAEKRAAGTWQNWSRGRTAKGKTLPNALSWEERCAAYDGYLDREVEAELQERLVAARRQLVADELDEYNSQLKKWREVRDRTLLHEQQRSARAKKNPGTTGEEVEIIFAELNIKDWYLLTQWRKSISDQGRRVLGMPDRISEANVKDWRSQAIEDIRAGRITYGALSQAFDDDLATELFRLAGVLIDSVDTDDLR